MKRIITFFFMLVSLSLAICLGADALSQSDVISEAAVLMDAQTGQILFAKNADKKMFPASTTKIMTALLTAEACGMDELATANKSAIDIDEWDSSNINLVPGEQMTLNELMYAMMLPSANDAANVLAEHVAGSQREFSQKMTGRAKELGAMNTRFANAHGLHDPEHYTTARDMALITREAIENPVFMKYFGEASYLCQPTNKNPYQRQFRNYQQMLIASSEMYDPSVTGGKIGYTHEAMHTMSTAAQRNGRTLVCVVLYSNNRNDKFTDTKKLFDFGFDEFYTLTIPKEMFAGFTEPLMLDGMQVGTVGFKALKDFSAIVHKSVALDDIEIEYSHRYPFEKNEIVSAYAEFRLKSAGLGATRELGIMNLAPTVTNFEPPAPAQESLTSKGWFWPFVISFCVLALLGVLYTMRRISLHRKALRRRARMERIRRYRDEMYSGGPRSGF